MPRCHIVVGAMGLPDVRWPGGAAMQLDLCKKTAMGKFLRRALREPRG